MVDKTTSQTRNELMPVYTALVTTLVEAAKNGARRDTCVNALLHTLAASVADLDPPELQDLVVVFFNVLQHHRRLRRIEDEQRALQLTRDKDFVKC